MTVKFSTSKFPEELTIETSYGKIKVSVQGINKTLKIEGEEHLPQLGMTINDAIALFLDQAASKETSARFANYIGLRKKME